MHVITRALQRRPLVSGCVLSAIVALVAAIASVTTFSLSPPGLKSRGLEVSGAAARVAIDARESRILSPPDQAADLASLRQHADLVANLMASDQVVELIAAKSEIAFDRIAAVPRITDQVQQTMLEPDSERRANQIRLASSAYRLEFQADPVLPLLNVYAQAPTTLEATRLADAAVDGLQEYLTARAARDGTSPGRQLVLRQLGPARGGAIKSSAAPQIALFTFLVVWSLCFLAWMVAVGARRQWIAGRSLTGQPLSGASTSSPGDRIHRGRSTSEVRAAAIKAADDWPRTTRILPWGVAAFVAMLWLVPFNSIELAADLPFDLKLDRLMLPVIVGAWVLTWAAGGPTARPRPTAIHVCVVGFVAVGCVSVVLNASSLNQTLELDLATKKVVLLLAYLSLFMVVASVVRRSEAPAFLRYTLVLAVLCAMGTIWEYNFHFNVFYDLAQKLLPGIFDVQVVAESSAVDQIGRRLTRGPAEHPLEAVAMLSMALPIALVGMMGSAEWRGRLLYGFAACILFAAAISTYRKSALLVPLSVILTLAYFRRGDLLRLAPLGLALGVVIHVLSPGALGSVLVQLKPSRLGVGTVSDRAADYDAVRPDLWLHPFFGRGFGSFDHVSYRILDSDVLARLVDTGVLGLIASVLMPLSVVIVARAPIRSTDRVSSTVALVGAAAAVAYLTASTLFDATSYPHTPYILLVFAALVAVVSGQDDASDAARDARPSHGRVGSSPVRRSSHADDGVPRASRRVRA